MITGLISEETYFRVHEQGNLWINLPVRDPFERIHELFKESGVEPLRLKIERDIAIANSSYISYLQLGRPENVLIVLEEMLLSVSDSLQVALSKADHDGRQPSS